MDKAQKELLKTYYRKRGIAGQQSSHYSYRPYEYSVYAIKNKIMDLSKLSIAEQYKIYQTNKAIAPYILPYIEAYNNKSSGFLKILNDGTDEELVLFLDKSELLADREFNIKGNYIDIDIDENDILTALDLEDDYGYSYVKSTASRYYSGYYDDYELNYMYSYLSTENMRRIKEIAKTLGASQETINNFSEEGELTKFLEEYHLDTINETFNSEYSEAKNASESMAAQKQLDSFPFDIDTNETTIDIDNTIAYMYEHDLNNVQSFDEFINYLGSNNDINSEQINEEAYELLDTTDLNRYIGYKLDDVIDGFDNPDSDYYEQVQGNKELDNLLTKLKFTPVHENGVIATYSQPDKTINVIDYGYDEGDDNLKIKIKLVYTDGNERLGWILAKNLNNYIGQREIETMRENLKIR